MKKGLLTSLGCLLISIAFSQNNPPVAVDDTVTAISQVPLIIDVLANDYDPDGNFLTIDHWTNPNFGEVDTVDGKIRYKSESGIVQDHFRYWVIDNGTPPEVSSSSGRVQIDILPNPDAPVANPDTFELLELEPVNLDILANDLDPNGDELKIYEIDNEYHCNVIIQDDSLMVTVIAEMTSSMNASFKYSASEKNTPEHLVSDWTKVFITIIPNPDIPVAVSDTASTTGGIPMIIPVMANDYDPQGDTIEISDFGQPANGSIYQSGDSLVYTPQVSFKGTDSFWYTIREVYDTTIHADGTHSYINVSKNPDCPIGVPDQAGGMIFTPITIDVLANDYDPNGDLLEIWGIQSTGSTSISDNKIIYTSDLLASHHDSLFYRARQSNDAAYYSEWTAVYIDLSSNPAFPEAVEDHITARAVFPIVISPLDNDILNTADSLRILYAGPAKKGRVSFMFSDSLIRYQAYSNAAGPDSFEYVIVDRHNQDLQAKGKVYIDITDNDYYDSLIINNINAGVSADGMLFANVGQFPGGGMRSDYRPHFKYPKGSETNTIFNSLIWIGGISGPDSLFFEGGMYRGWGSDIQPGPISNVYDSTFAERYWKLWKLNKTEIDYHRDNWSMPGYQPIKDIATWPGNGIADSGQAMQLAPYADVNQDGKYDPMDGDYPLIRGDQCIYFIMNDDKTHDETYGDRVKVEIHGMVYGFDAPADSALWNTVFVHYDLINRSEKTYRDTYIGIFTDFDIGYPWDDYVGAEVARSSYYAYNGTDFDYNITGPDNPSPGYGEFPPAQSVTVLAGPFMDADETDNPSGSCDFSVNGLNFGNGINDDERLGLTNFIFRSFTGPQHTIYAREYYYMTKSMGPDGSKYQFGANGYGPGPGPDCRYMYPGDSDPVNWGTDCVTPNPPYNQDGIYWADSSINVPGDRTGIGSMGPFTFAPGQVQEIDLAYCAANGWNGPVSSIIQLMENLDSLRSRVNNGEIIVPNASLGIHEKKVPSGLLKVFPNPASTNITIQLPGTIPAGTEYRIYNVLGDVAASGRIVSSQQFAVNISGLRMGFYIVKIRSKDSQLSGKFIKR
jgi:hypothetical protein